MQCREPGAYVDDGVFVFYWQQLSVTPKVLLSLGDGLLVQPDVVKVVDYLQGPETFLTGVDQGLRVLGAALPADQPPYKTSEFFYLLGCS